MSQADEIWTGGVILTMDGANPRAEALAVKDGRLVAVGSASDVLNLSGPGTKIHDLSGRFVMPGLVESHTHALWGACRTLFDIYVMVWMPPWKGIIMCRGDVAVTSQK